MGLGCVVLHVRAGLSSADAQEGIDMFEVRTEVRDAEDVPIPNKWQVETRRTNEKVAKEDVAIFAMFNKRAWIVDTDA